MLESWKNLWSQTEFEFIDYESSVECGKTLKNEKIVELCTT